MSNRSRRQVRLSRALGIALTPKAQRIFENVRMLRVSMAVPAAAPSPITHSPAREAASARSVWHLGEAAPRRL